MLMKQNILSAYFLSSLEHLLAINVLSGAILSPQEQHTQV